MRGSNSTAIITRLVGLDDFMPAWASAMRLPRPREFGQCNDGSFDQNKLAPQPLQTRAYDCQRPAQVLRGIHEIAPPCSCSAPSWHSSVRTSTLG